MRNRIMKPLCALLCCAVAGLSISAPAQDRNWGFRIQFGPDLDRVIQQAENHTSQLTAMLDQRGHEGLSERARDLESQLNMVGGDFDRSSRYDRRSQVANVLRVAEDINRAMRYRRVDFDVQRQWSMVRYDLNRLARAYHLRQIY